jgi:hypothetical protein
MSDLLSKLTGGDRRSIGRSDEVVAEVLANPTLFEPLFKGMLADDPLVRMRAADAVEKITTQQPELLTPYKDCLLQEVSRIEQQEVRWHVAQLLPRLTLTPAERQQTLAILEIYLQDKSKIVKTFAMQALADLAEQDPNLRPSIITRLETLTASGSPAMRSRGRKLLVRLESKDAMAHES